MLYRRPRSVGRFFASCLFVGSSVVLLTLAYQALELRLFRLASAIDELDGVTEAEALTALRSGSVRCGNIRSLFPGRIPPIVHWTNRDERVLSKHIKLVRSWSNVLGDSAAYMLWEDAKIEQLLQRHYPELWKRYKLLGAGILRSDIGRLAIIDHVGGIYTDMDVRLLRNFLPLLNNHTSLWSQEPLEHAYYLYNVRRLVSNALFMSQAGHPFLSHVLRTWPRWFDTNWLRRPSRYLRNSGSAVAMTGPLMLNKFLDEYEKSGRSREEQPTLAEPAAFQPKWDEGAIPGVARRRCAFTAIMNTEQREWCIHLRMANFKSRGIPPDSYAVHLYLHTGYGGPVDYTDAAKFASILNASSCII